MNQNQAEHNFRQISQCFIGFKVKNIFNFGKKYFAFCLLLVLFSFRMFFNLSHSFENGNRHGIIMKVQ